MQPRLALLIDGENISAKHFPEIARRALSLGDLRISRVVADFSDGRRPGWLKHAQTYGLRPVMQLSGGKGKNSTDIEVTIEAIDLLYSGNIDALLLASSDRDFAPLVQRLRDGGLFVYGIGLAPPDTSLAEYCDGYFLLEQASKPDVPAPEIARAQLAPVAPPAIGLKISADERAFLIDLLADTCKSGSGQVTPSALGLQLHKRNKPLAERIGSNKLLKTLRQLGIATETGSGSALQLSPKPKTKAA